MSNLVPHLAFGSGEVAFGAHRILEYFIEFITVNTALSLNGIWSLEMSVTKYAYPE